MSSAKPVEVADTSAKKGIHAMKAAMGSKPAAASSADTIEIKVDSKSEKKQEAEAAAGDNVEEVSGGVIPEAPLMSASPPLPASQKADRPLTGRGGDLGSYDLSGLDANEFSGPHGAIMKLLNSYVSAAAAINVE